MKNDTLYAIDGIVSGLPRNNITRMKGSTQDTADLVKIAMAWLEEQRDEGVLFAIQAEDPARIAFIESWNGFIEGADPDKLVTRAIMQSILNTARMYVFPEDEAETNNVFASHLTAQIICGFPEIEKDSFISHPEAYDRLTGKHPSITFSGWSPKFWVEGDASQNYDRELLDIRAAEPKIVHMVLPAGEPIWLISGRGAGTPITNALYNRQIEDNDVVYGMNSDVGKIALSKSTYEADGVMMVSLGDSFPQPVTEKETGKTWLMNFGNVVSEKTASELEAEKDEDWAAGYFLVEDDRFTAAEGGHLDNMRIAPQSYIVALLSSELNISPHDAQVMLETEARDEFAQVFSLDAMTSEAHIYMAYGANVKGSHKAMVEADQYPFRGGRECSVIISPEPIVFPDGVVEELDAKPPSSELSEHLIDQGP
jgi:hypothetical protein